MPFYLLPLFRLLHHGMEYHFWVPVMLNGFTFLHFSILFYPGNLSTSSWVPAAWECLELPFSCHCRPFYWDSLGTLFCSGVFVFCYSTCRMPVLPQACCVPGEYRFLPNSDTPGLPFLPAFGRFYLGLFLYHSGRIQDSLRATLDSGHLTMFHAMGVLPFILGDGIPATITTDFHHSPATG